MLILEPERLENIIVPEWFLDPPEVVVDPAAEFHRVLQEIAARPLMMLRYNHKRIINPEGGRLDESTVRTEYRKEAEAGKVVRSARCEKVMVRPRGPEGAYGMAWGEIIDRIQKITGMNYSAIGRKVGKSYRVIFHWRNDTTRPNKENAVALLNLARACGLIEEARNEREKLTGSD